MLKTLDSDSKWAEADTDGDGVITEEEIEFMNARLGLRMKTRRKTPSATWPGLLCLECFSILLLFFYLTYLVYLLQLTYWVTWPLRILFQ